MEAEIEASKVQERSEKDQLWDAYAKACFEYGQIKFTIEKAESQVREFEKQLDVALRNMKSTAHKFDEFMKAQRGPAQVTQ
jgi:hypothetical protein